MIRWMICLFLATTTVSGLCSEQKLDWLKEYEQGVAASTKQKKPMILYFTGSDWCPWCFKIQDEVISDPAFVEAMKDSFIFVKIDFPKRTLLPEAVKKRNQELREEFKVRTFPTVVMFDPDVGVITKMGYLDIGGQKYAEQLKNSLSEYQMIRKALHSTPKEWDESLEKLYEKAKHLGCQTYIKKIYDQGLARDPGPFFLLEKYAHTIQKKGVDTREISQLRSEIINRDPENIQGSHRRLAILDFQHNAEDEKNDPSQVVRPLLKYIDVYGRSDKDHLWQLEMMISQYLFSRDKVALALKHARRSYKAAPKAVRKEISDSILYLKGQLVTDS